MEIFNIPGPVLFLDLDTIIVDNIDCIIKSLKDQPFVTLRDAFRGGSNIGSGIMSWSKNVSYLYRAFAKDDKRFMRELLILLNSVRVAFLRNRQRQSEMRHLYAVLPTQSHA